jgi:hypothetical protein
MSATEFLLWIASLTLLWCYLRIKHHQTLRSAAELRDPPGWTGKTIDVTLLKPRIEDVRRNYIAAHPPVQGVCFHRVLIELARRAVAQLAYFHGRDARMHLR